MKENMMITFLLLYKECVVALKEGERKRLLTSRRGWGGKTSQGRGDLMVTGVMGSQATALANQEPVPLAKPWRIWTLDFKVEGHAEEVTSYIMRCLPAILLTPQPLCLIPQSFLVAHDNLKEGQPPSLHEGKGHITVYSLHALGNLLIE